MRYLRGGVRIGAQAMTTCGCSQDDFKKITELLDRRGQITLRWRSADPGSSSSGLGTVMRQEKCVSAVPDDIDYVISSGAECASI